ncbi:MAG TPA: hypothetical protein VGN88_14260 [Phycisphaerae bacterium]
MTRLSHRALPVLLALCAASANLAHAQDKPKDPVVVARLSIGSIDAFNKLIADLGLAGVGDFDIKRNLEEAPFLGKDTIAMDKPIGVAIMVSDSHKLFPFEDSFVMGVPVMPGKVLPADLRTAGGTALDAVPNGFSIPSFGSVRRTDDYIFAKPPGTTFGLATITDAVFAPDYKDVSNLFVISANADAMRKNAPDAYKELAKAIVGLPQMIGGIFGPILGGAAPAAPDPDPKPALAVMDKIDKFTLAFGQDEKNIHLKSWLAPTPFDAKAKEAPRPAFPAGSFVQMHLVYPSPDAAAFLEKQLSQLPEDFFGGDLPPVYHERVKDLVIKAANLNTRTDAVSLAVTVKDKHPVLYLVDQFSDGTDAMKEITEILEIGSALSTEAGGNKFDVVGSTYDAGGKKIQRLVVGPGDAKDKLIIDEVQTGKVAYFAISDNADGKYVADLAAAGMNGNSSALCAGAVDLGAIMAAAADTGGMPGLNPDELQKLKTALAGQGITWTVQSSDQNFLFADIQVPKQVLRDLIKITSAGDSQNGPPMGNPGALP